MQCTVEVVIPGLPTKTSLGLIGLSSIYLIKTPRTTILFDTGGFGQRRRLLPRLKEMGCPPDSIEHLILSHAHWDHMLNVTLFPRARVYAHRADMEHALKPEGSIDPSYPMPYMRQVLDSQFYCELDGEATEVEGVGIIHTPGHSLGSIAAVVETAWGRTVLAGDAIKNRAEYFSHSYDLRGDERVFLDSVAKIRAAADAIAPGHDLPFDCHSGAYLAPEGEPFSMTVFLDRDMGKKATYTCRREA